MDESRASLHDLPILKFLPGDVRELVVDSFVPEAFYVLVSGRARVIKTGRGGEEVSLNVLRQGESFGEMALLEKTTRAATVRASSDVEVFRLDRSVFDALVETNPDIRKYLELHVRHRSLSNFFRLYAPFARLPTDALSILLEELEPVTAEKGERVIHEGEEAGPLYIVEEGRL